MFDRFLIDFGVILVTKIDKKSQLIPKNEAETVWAANNEPRLAGFGVKECPKASQMVPKINSKSNKNAF